MHGENASLLAVSSRADAPCTDTASVRNQRQSQAQQQVPRLCLGYGVFTTGSVLGVL